MPHESGTAAPFRGALTRIFPGLERLRARVPGEVFGPAAISDLSRGPWAFASAPAGRIVPAAACVEPASRPGMAYPTAPGNNADHVPAAFPGDGATAHWPRPASFAITCPKPRRPAGRASRPA